MLSKLCRVNVIDILYEQDRTSKASFEFSKLIELCIKNKYKNIIIINC